MSSAQKKIERDGLIDIIDDREFPPPDSGGAPSWRILIVDDEKDVHSATLFALSDRRMLSSEPAAVSRACCTLSLSTETPSVSRATSGLLVALPAPLVAQRSRSL